MPVCLYVGLSISFVCLYICLCLSVFRLPVSLFVCFYSLSVAVYRLPVCLSLGLFVSLVCVSVCVYLCCTIPELYTFTFNVAVRLPVHIAVFYFASVNHNCTAFCFFGIDGLCSLVNRLFSALQ